jgi:hypothetical protein
MALRRIADKVQERHGISLSHMAVRRVLADVGGEAPA